MNAALHPLVGIGWVLAVTPLLIAIGRHLARRTGSVVVLRAAPSLVATLPPRQQAALRAWMQLAALLGLGLPLLVLVLWSNTDLVRQALLPYVALLLVQLGTEWVLIHRYAAAMGPITGLLYTAFRVWQLGTLTAWVLQAPPAGMAGDVVLGVLLIGLVFWVLNLALLVSVVLPRLVDGMGNAARAPLPSSGAVRASAALPPGMSDAEKRSYRVINVLVVALLQSPLHALLSRRVLAITYRGRRSGIQRTVPVSYLRHGERIICVTSPSWSTWWRNLDGGVEVQVCVAGQTQTAIARAVRGEHHGMTEELAAFLRVFPATAKRYAVAVEPDGLPNGEDVHAAVVSRMVVLIRIDLARTATGLDA